MQSKSKNLNQPFIFPGSLLELFKDPWTISSLMHGFLVVFALGVFFGASFKKKESVDIEVLEAPKLAPQPVQLTKPAVPAKKNLGHKVFGISRKAATSDQGEEVKAGNTLAKTPDDEKLRPQDQDTLPIPSEEYLITKMPELSSEVRVPYPAGPKKRGITGAVVMDLLIDSAGKVRDANVVEGPDPELSSAAATAARDFHFSPALIQDKPVAVRIRYVYRFVLER